MRRYCRGEILQRRCHGLVVAAGLWFLLQLAATEACGQETEVDLKVTDISWSPLVPAIGEEVTFSINIKNVLSPGGTVAEDFTLRSALSVDQEDAIEKIFDIDLGDLVVTDDIPSGEFITVQQTWTATSSTGRFSLRATVDVTEAVGEANEDNNVTYLPYRDLRVKHLASTTETPQVGEQVTFTATIENQGTVDIDEDFVVEFIINGSTVAAPAVTDTVTHAGGTVQVQHVWTADAEQFIAQIVADANDDVREDGDGEWNNAFSKGFAIDNADYVVEDIRYDTNGSGWGYKAVIRNDGADSVRSSTVRWYIDGVDQGTTSIGGLGAGAKAETMITYRPGDQIRVVCDASDVIEESDETNNELSEDLDRPDLVVGDIWWSPENPVDGQNVTFYARIDNLGADGATEDFDVRFTVDAGLDTEVVLGTTRVSEDAPPAQRLVPFENADFELGDLTGWTSGGNCEIRSRYQTGNEHSARIWDGGWLRSPAFALTEEHLVFSGYTAGSPGVERVRVRRAADDAVLEDRRYEPGSPWHVYVIDVADHLGETAYVEFVTEGEYGYRNGNWGRWYGDFYVDDLRMAADTSAVVSFAAPGKGTWQAHPGTYTITAWVDVKDDVGEVTESDETNQDLTEPFEVFAPDYVVEDIRYDTNGSGWGYKAVIRNDGADTVRSSTVRWYIDGEDQGTTTIGGLGEGEKAETMITYRPGDHIRVVCDSADVIDESDETNNELSEDLDRPDLVVGDIWWSPADPVDGQDVTFYARIDNLGADGATEDFDVRFTVDAGLDTEVVLGTTRVSEDAPPAQRLVPFENADFELGDLTGWTSGGNCEIRSRYQTGNEHSARIWDGGWLRSPAFALTEEHLVFSGYTAGSPGVERVRVRRAADDAVLEDRRYEPGSPWHVYVIDVADHLGETAYVEFVTEGEYGYRNGNWGRWYGDFYVDDLRMAADTSAVVSFAAPGKGTWQAQPGEHTITVELDVRNEIIEAFEENNILKRASGDSPAPIVEVSPDGIASNEEPVGFSLSFNREVYELLEAELLVINGSVVADSLTTGNDWHFTLDVTPTAEGDVKLRVPTGVAVDIDGIGNIASNLAVVTYDATPPTAGVVRDGATPGVDMDWQDDTDTVSANWEGFADGLSGIASYEWSIGTSTGATDVVGWTSVGLDTSATVSGLSLVNGATYYASVRAIDEAGNTGDTGTSNGVTKTQTLAPVVDLDAETEGIDFATVFVEDSGPSAIVDDDGLTLTDVDSTHMHSASVTITNLLDGASEALLVDVADSGISAEYDSTEGILYLTGSDTLESYQTVLRTVRYDNLSNTPNEADRIIEFRASDGARVSAAATATVSVTAANDAPVVDLNGEAEGLDFTAQFTEDGGPVGIVDADALIAMDVDNAELVSATLTVTNPLDGAAESLSADTGDTGIAAAYDPATGVLTLTGAATPAEYQTVLRTVTYNNADQNPDTAARSITVAVNDGELHSAPATVTITVVCTDADTDHVPDDWEQQIIEADPGDGIDSVDDVLPGDDFDGDGRSNFEEYAFCLDPCSGVETNQQQTSLANDAGMPALDVTIHVRSNDANLSYTVETCTDLAAGDWTGGALTHTGGTWSSAHAPVTVVSQTEESSGVWSVTLRLPVNDTAGFLRLDAQ